MADTNVHRVVGNLLVGSSHFYVDTSTNKVGITTTNPQAGLHVNSNAYVETDLKIGSGVVINDTTVSTTTFAVTVTLNPNKFHIDAVETPVLSLQRGNTYVFDLSDGSNLTHPLAFSTASGSGSYTTGVTDNYDTILPGNSGSQVTFVVPESAPSTFYYYCETHGWGMGSSTASTISDRGGRVTASYFHGDGSNLTNIAGDSGSWVNGTNSNVHLATSTDKVGIGVVSPGAELHVAGTGAIIVPVGTTGERPGTTVNGMFRYNSETGYMEAYTASGWGALATPPSIVSISPLTTLPSGGQAEGVVHQAELVHPTPATNDYFGTFISLTSDGTRAIVGCWGDHLGSLDNVGSAHVYKRTGTTWTHEDELLDPSPTSNSPSKFGYAVEISEDGLYAFVGAPRDKVDPSSGAERGSVHVFVRSGTTWSYQREMNEPVPDNGSEFGHCVSTNSDGSRVLISAPGAVVGSVDPAGAMYVFSRSGTTWTLEATLDESMVGGFSGGVEQYEDFGNAISLSSDGAYAITGVQGDEKTGGASASGVAHIFYRSGTSWTHQKSLSQDGVSADATAAQYNGFGCSVDITSDGSRVVIGARNTLDGSKSDAGAAYIFVRSGTTWTFERYLEHPVTATGDKFGATVRITANGDRVVVGAPYDDTTGGSDMGSAHIFDRSGTTWTVTSGQTGLLHPASASSFMMTGEATHGQLAISADGKYVTLGVPRDDIFAGAPLASQGTVQVYSVVAQVFDASTQVFTVTGSSFDQGLAINLVGADGTNYQVVDRTFVNTATATFKIGDLSSATAQVANRPYNVKITSGSGLAATSTQTIGFSGISWTSPAAGATLATFVTTTSANNTELAATDDVGGNDVTFSVPAANLPPGLTLNTSTGAITGQIGGPTAAVSVTFRVTDNVTGATLDRTFSIVGVQPLYPFTTHTFTNAGKTGSEGPTITQLQGSYGTTGSTYWVPAYLNVTSGIQEWTVPLDGTYEIKIAGAGGAAGGSGAEQVLDLNLTKSTILKICVGQKGTTSYPSQGGGGGGGSFLVDNTTLLCASGGAGGFGGDATFGGGGGWGGWGGGGGGGGWYWFRWSGSEWCWI